MKAELQMVLEAIQSLGQDGKQAFIWWLVMKYGSQAVAWTMGWGTVAFVATSILRTVRHSIKVMNVTDLKVEVEKHKAYLDHQAARRRTKGSSVNKRLV